MTAKILLRKIKRQHATVKSRGSALRATGLSPLKSPLPVCASKSSQQ
jgi:hypothetical protein